VLVGSPGVGKTGLASGLLLKALENGYRCQFIRAQDWFDQMYASLADRSSRQLLNRLSRLDVLSIAALNTANGEVHGLCQQKHSHQERLRFLADLF